MTAYPSAPEVLYELVDGQSFDGQEAAAYLRLQVDFTDNLPAVLIYDLGGTESYIDRTDRVGVDVYAAAGTAAKRVAEAIKDAVKDRPHDTTHGYIDSITVETTPVDVPYADPDVSQAQMVLRVTSRPL